MENKKQSSDDKIKNILKKLDRNAIIIGLVGIIFLFGFTIIATQYNLWFDYNNTGQIGDTIGGLTAPIIGIFSALLIYLSFRAQIQANLTIQQQITDQKKEGDEKKEREIQMEMYKEIKDAILSYKFETMIGIEAIHRYFFLLQDKNSSTLFKKHFVFRNIFELIKILINRINDATNREIDSKLALILIDYLNNQIMTESSYKILLHKDFEETRIEFKLANSAKINGILDLANTLNYIDNNLLILKKRYQID